LEILVSNRNFGKFGVFKNKLVFPINKLGKFGVSTENLGFPKENLAFQIEIFGNCGLPIEVFLNLGFPQIIWVFQ
jgi:hypothetical protein